MGPSPRLRSLVVVAAAALPAGCGADDGGARPRADVRTDRATVVDDRPVASRVRDLTIRSPALRGQARVRLLTPAGWSRRRGSRRWPVLYLLHGCCDTYDSWTRETAVERMRGLRDVLVVMPDGGRVGFYSDWRGGNGDPGPRWETFHLRELRTILERDYRAGPRRVVAGLSMGGLGAMGYTARNAGLFRAAASFSGLLHPLGDPQSVFALLGAFTPDPLALWGDARRDRDVWARHDPTELATRLRGTPLFVSSGDGRLGRLDEPGRRRDPVEQIVRKQSRSFVQRLRELGLEVTADFYGAGTHTWPYWERGLRRALPMLRAALGRRR
jgi:diacylglycerol O-acyltransferase / trehalose O-mycolyltransferase